MKANRHCVYVQLCADETFYCGYTTDVERRVQEHNGLSNIAGAKYTSGRRPVHVIHIESFATRSAAQKREAEIKKMPRKVKMKWYTKVHK